MITLKDLQTTQTESDEIVRFWKSPAGEKMEARIEYVKEDYLSRAMGFSGSGKQVPDQTTVTHLVARAAAMKDILDDIDSLILADKLNHKEGGEVQQSD